MRLALGSPAGVPRRLVLREGLRLALIGTGVGLAAAPALTRLLEAQLFGVSATDLLTLLGAAVVLTAVGLAATYLPARRASRVSPMEVLRWE